MASDDLGTPAAAQRNQIAPVLGRNLSAGPTATATIDLIPNNTSFEKRLTQLDLRLTKTVHLGHARVQGNFDIYNIFNATTIGRINTRFGPSWLQPT